MVGRVVMAAGHAASGALAGALTAPVLLPAFEPVTVAVYVAVCVVGALAPDLDHPCSKLSHALPPVTWLLNKFFVVTAKLEYHATRGPDDPQHTNGHRCLWHQAEPAAALGGLVWLALDLSPAGAYAWPVAAALTVGMWAHIVGDCCTNSGCPVFTTVVLVRMVLGYERRWVHYGIPQCLRFKAGGPVGEPLATVVLTVGAVAASVLLLPGAWTAISQLAG